MGPPASWAASAVAAGSTSSSSSTSVVSSPRRSASAARTGWASSSISVALACPTSRGRVQDSPVSAARAISAKAIRKLVDGPPTRKSASSARPTRHRRRCRAPRRPPASAARPAPRRSGCSAPPPCPAAAPGIGQVGGVLLEVLADAEGPAGAGEQHRPALPVGGESGDGVPQRLLERGVQRVERVGPVHGEGDDAAGPLDQQYLVHRCSSLAAGLVCRAAGLVCRVVGLSAALPVSGGVPVRVGPGGRRRVGSVPAGSPAPAGPPRTGPPPGAAGRRARRRTRPPRPRPR